MHITQEQLTVDDVLLAPLPGLINSRSEAKMLDSYIFSAPMETVSGPSLIKAQRENNLNQLEVVLSRFIDKENYYNSIQTGQWVAVGLDNYKQVLKYINEKNIDIKIALDIAHGTIPKALDVYTELAQNQNVAAVMSGSLCTIEQAQLAYQYGCTHLRIGIGPGAACTTRIVTGCGWPQLSAVNNIYNIQGWVRNSNIRHLSNFYKKPVLIADGGIRNPGDIVKYLAAGADAVMLGSILANTKEADGWNNGIKCYKGQASKEFHEAILGKTQKYVEGVTTKVWSWENAKSITTVLDEIDSGIRSAISYLGIKSMRELNPSNVLFVKITPAGMRESLPHGAM